MLPFLCCVSYNSPAFASQQEYIAAIKADVAEFSTGAFDPPAGSSWLVSDQASQGEVDLVITLEAFSAFLQTKSPGTSIFYRKLTLEDRRKVYQDYLETGDFERTKKQVLRFAGDHSRR
jgi:hypothetical protein